MRKVLALILALTMVVAAFTLTSCNDGGKETKETDAPKDTSGATLAGKTPEQTYAAALESLKNMTNYELYVSEGYSTDFIGETVSSVSNTVYKLSGNTAYAKKYDDAGTNEEQWFVDNVLYYSAADNKEKIEMDINTFLSSYTLDTTTLLFALKSEEFSGIKFVEENGLHFLKFELTPEKFEEYIGGTLSENAYFNVGFYDDGALASVQMITATTTSAGARITMETKFELKNVGKAAVVTAPENTDEYRVAPQMSSLDMIAIPDLASVTVSETETDYVMFDIENYGKIVVRLYDEVAPKTVENFKKLVKNGFYDGLIFHRVIEDFMIQGGGYDAENNYKESESINGEFASNGFSNNLLHKRGVISMARTDDPNSAGAQFFIMHADATHLDGSYAAFGYTVYGLDVVDAIATVETDDSDCPTTTVKILSAKFVTVE